MDEKLFHTFVFFSLVRLLGSFTWAKTKQHAVLTEYVVIVVKVLEIALATFCLIIINPPLLRRILSFQFISIYNICLKQINHEQNILDSHNFIITTILVYYFNFDKDLFIMKIYNQVVT